MEQEEEKKSLAEVLAESTAVTKQLMKANDVAAAAGGGGDGSDLEQPVVVEKGLKGADLDEQHIDPLRHGFERLAKAMPSRFGELGQKSVLDNPYAIIRAKNADGSYVMSRSQLNALMTGLLGINSDDPVAHGAMRVEEWASKSGNPQGAIEGAFEQAFEQKSFGANSAMVRKAVDSTTGSGALIRVDIEPVLREAFNRVFPGFDLFEKIPANGINHSWNQVTAPGTATLLAELGDFSGTASTNTYSRQATTNIAVAASQREISLKAQWASMQSGMNYLAGGGSNVEVMGALTALAMVIQAQIFQGNFSTASKTLDDEEGLTNTLGFDGFRTLLKHNDYSINKGSDTYLTVLRRAIGELVEFGADSNEVAIFCSVGINNAIDAELETFYQFSKGESGAQTPLNFSGAGLAMLRGILGRIHAVPAEGAQAKGIGYYTYSAATTEDIYVLDPNGNKLPYIGSPGPTILELPTGWGNHLSNTYVPFIMIGLAPYVKLFNRKIRCAQATI